MIDDLVVPGVLSLVGPTGPVRPLMLDSPHSGTCFPDDFETVVSREMLLEAVDTAVDRLFRPSPGSGLTLLHAHFPRTYVDPNRAATDIDEDMLDRPWPGSARPTGRSARGNGLIRRTLSGDLFPLYDRRLSVSEVAARISRYHEPYHRTLARLHRVLHATFGTVYHLNCHSMRSRNTDDGTRRPDFELGDRNGTTCTPEFTGFAAELLSDLGYDVHVNRMFRGAEIIRAYAAPDDGHHCLQIEVNKDLYMDESTRTLLPAFDRLRSDLATVLDRLGDFAAAHAAPGRNSAVSRNPRG